MNIIIKKNTALIKCVFIHHICKYITKVSTLYIFPFLCIDAEMSPISLDQTFRSLWLKSTCGNSIVNNSQHYLNVRIYLHFSALKRKIWRKINIYNLKYLFIPLSSIAKNTSQIIIITSSHMWTESDWKKDDKPHMKKARKKNSIYNLNISNIVGKSKSKHLNFQSSKSLIYLCTQRVCTQECTQLSLRLKDYFNKYLVAA